MGEDYVIDFLSDEWILNSFLSFLYVSISLFIGFKLDIEKKNCFC